MGLDVYLYRRENNVAKGLLEAEYQQYQEDNKLDWGDPKLKEFAESRGLNEYGQIDDGTRIELDSTKHPDNMFKIGYMRSSYNGAGINSILQDAIGKDLYYIFDQGNVQTANGIVSWTDSLQLCKEVTQEFQEYVDQTHGFDVMEIPTNFFSVGSNPEINAPRAAMDAFLEEFNRDNKPFEGGYSNAKGDFFLNSPIEVYALIDGWTSHIKEVPVVYAITKRKHGYDFYFEALEIVQEMIEWVLAQKDPENYYFRWSG